MFSETKTRTKTLTNFFTKFFLIWLISFDVLWCGGLKIFFKKIFLGSWKRWIVYDVIISREEKLMMVFLFFHHSCVPPLTFYNITNFIWFLLLVIISCVPPFIHELQFKDFASASYFNFDYIFSRIFWTVRPWHWASNAFFVTTNTVLHAFDEITNWVEKNFHGIPLSTKKCSGHNIQLPSRHPWIGDKDLRAWDGGTEKHGVQRRMWHCSLHETLKKNIFDEIFRSRRRWFVKKIRWRIFRKTGQFLHIAVKNRWDHWATNNQPLFID